MTSSAGAPEPIPPQALIMQMALGALVTKVVAEATRLNIPDLLKRHGAMSVGEMIGTGGMEADESALYRVLRACAAAGVFSEDPSGRFGLTELSEPLTSDSAVSVKKIVELFGGMISRVACELGETVRTGKPQVRAIFGLEFWDYLHANPRELEEFGEAMKSNSQNSLRSLLEMCDFSETRHVADIGGGFGHLALALVEKYPGLRATVLDRPEVVQVARQHLPVKEARVAERLGYTGGDMFDSVPEADTYIMKHIIHDWEDEKSIQVLANCRRNMQGDGRVICVDTVLPPKGDSAGLAAKLLDIVMLTHITGKERTEEQWNAIYGAAGLRVQSITPIRDNFGTSIVVGVKRGM